MATTAVVVLEAWVTFATPGEEFDATEVQSGAIDRKDYMFLIGEAKAENKQKFPPLIRSGNGIFFGFGELYESGAKTQSRFTGLIPSHPPDAQMREITTAMLQIKGAGCIQWLNRSLRLNPS